MATFSGKLLSATVQDSNSVFLDLFTLEESLKYYSGFKEPLHRKYYIYNIYFLNNGLSGIPSDMSRNTKVSTVPQLRSPAIAILESPPLPQVEIRCKLYLESEDLSTLFNSYSLNTMTPLSSQRNISFLL